MKESPLKEKSALFATRTVNLHKYLISKKNEFEISCQIKRAGMSISANVWEAQAAESKADFIHKLAIANKEASETLLWLRLLNSSNFITDREYHSLNDDCLELKRMLASSIKTAKNNLPQK